MIIMMKLMKIVKHTSEYEKLNNGEWGDVLRVRTSTPTFHSNLGSFMSQ